MTDLIEWQDLPRTGGLVSICRRYGVVAIAGRGWVAELDIGRFTFATKAEAIAECERSEAARR